MFRSSFRCISLYRNTFCLKSNFSAGRLSNTCALCPIRNISYRQRQRKSKPPNEVLITPSVADSVDKGKAYKKILRAKTPDLTRMLVAVKSRRERYNKKIILLEGKRLITEALKANVEPVMILFSRKSLIDDLPLNEEYCNANNTILYRIPYKEIALWSDLTTSPGIFGIFKMPDLERHRPEIEPLPITMVCDNIREPGNLGSILRIAASIPVEKVILLTGCSDIWDSKVIRGSSGAMFYLNVSNNWTWEDVNDACNGEVILADHLGDDTECNNVPIPAEHIEVDQEAEIDDDESDAKEKLNLRQVFKLPLKSYCELDYTPNKSYVLIVGGETQGLSEQAFEFTSRCNGSRVHVPLSGCVNSLNAATAVGVISFEMKRQIKLSPSSSPN